MELTCYHIDIGKVYKGIEVGSAGAEEIFFFYVTNHILREQC